MCEHMPIVYLVAEIWQKYHCSESRIGEFHDDKDNSDTRQTQSAFDEALEIRAQITEDDSAQADVVNTNCNDQRKETTPL